MTTVATAFPHINAYHEELHRLIQFGGSENESQIRAAFSRCLDEYCRSHHDKLALVEELPFNPRVIPDGTVKDSLRLARGYWEAKDTRDDLEREIQNKFNRGYPRDNIIFEDSRMAVLFQNGAEAMRVNMEEAPSLHRLISTFLDYELPEIREFHKAQDQFSADLPTVLASLRETIDVAEADNAEYQKSAQEFLELCRRTIGPKVSEADVREMLLQHILTRDIFLRVFVEDQFHRENTIAIQLEKLEGTFFTGDVRRRSIERLRSYYGAIGRAADTVADFQEKQTFLKGVYEDFYKAYNPAAADRLGVVYTPNEVVDFMVRGTDYLLQKHFGKRLADNNVEILDPATGTGTFITSLINYLPLDRLNDKYHREIHANEVAILPYYIANLNIEYTYKERVGDYSRFPSLAFVDTLDNMDWQQGGAGGGAVTRQPGFNLGALSVDNWMRVQEQNERKISVIIGNPPYNANQQNENELNPNRRYPAIDQRIRETYVKESTAQKSKQYDMYKRFIRWASDRLEDDGIIAFVTNRAYLDTRQDDGFRRMAAQEFSDIYILDLGSDVRRNPKIAGTTHNVFGIQTGVAIGFFVREKTKLGDCHIHYDRREDEERATDKLSYLSNAALSDITFEEITPDAHANWLNQSDSDFESLVPLANKQTKLAKRQADEGAVFRLYSLGIATNRDDWAYDFDAGYLEDKVRFFINTYNRELKRFEWERPGTDNLSQWLDQSIKWTRELRTLLTRGRKAEFTNQAIASAHYRPFVKKFTYYDPHVTHERYQQPSIFPHNGGENRVISFQGPTSRRPFGVIATKWLPDLGLFIDGTQCLPLYRYTPDGTRISNITEWGLRQFRGHYGDESITPEQIFAYTYAALHDPVYREKYAIDLTREFPRLPFHEDFDEWVELGQELLDLHIDFEKAEPYPLKRVKKILTGKRVGAKPKAILRADADKESQAIDLFERTSLEGLPPGVLDYRLGNRSALEWIFDQRQEKTPRDPTVRERFNTYRFADHEESVIDLICRVTTVSLRTNEIVDELAKLSKLADNS